MIYLLPKIQRKKMKDYYLKSTIFTVCVERFKCFEGKTHGTSIIQTTTEFDQEQCTKRCCLRKDCVGLVYDSKTSKCYLTNKRDAPMTDNNDRKVCERIPG